VAAGAGWPERCPVSSAGLTRVHSALLGDGRSARVSSVHCSTDRLLDAPHGELKMLSEKLALGPPPGVRHHPGTRLPPTGNRGSMPSEDLGVAHD